MEQSQNDPHRDAIGMMILLLVVIMVTPFLIERYLFPVYVQYIYYTRLAFFVGLDWILSSGYVPTALFGWVDWFFRGASIAHSDLPYYAHSTRLFLESADSRTSAALISSITVSGELRREVEFASRLLTAFIMPVLLYLFYRVTKRILFKEYYNQKYTLDSFAESMARYYKTLLPVVFDNPQKYGLDEGHWRMSPTIKSYFLSQGCINEISKPDGDYFYLNLPKLRALLVHQLGDRWSGLDALSKEERFIFAAAIPKVISPSRGSKFAEAFCDDLGEAYSSEPGIEVFFNALLDLINPKVMIKPTKWFVSLVDVLLVKKYASISFRKWKYMRQCIKQTNKILKDPKAQEVVDELSGKHAFKYTLLTALMFKAWEGGGLPSCWFLWCKREDRHLFYVVNNMGRRVSWSECTGYFGHYLYEREVGFMFPNPMIKKAIEGVDSFMTDSFYNYIPLDKVD